MFILLQVLKILQDLNVLMMKQFWISMYEVVTSRILFIICAVVVPEHIYSCQLDYDHL